MGDPKRPVQPRKGRQVAHPKAERTGTGAPDGMKKQAVAVDDERSGEIELRLAFLAQEEEVVAHYDGGELRLPLPTPYALTAFQELFRGYNKAVEKKDTPGQMTAIGTLVWILQHERDADFDPAKIPDDVGLAITKNLTWRELKIYIAALVYVAKRMTEVTNLSVRQTPEKGPDENPADATTPAKG